MLPIGACSGRKTESEKEKEREQTDQQTPTIRKTQLGLHATTPGGCVLAVEHCGVHVLTVGSLYEFRQYMVPGKKKTLPERVRATHRATNKENG